MEIFDNEKKMLSQILNNVTRSQLLFLNSSDPTHTEVIMENQIFLLYNDLLSSIAYDGKEIIPFKRGDTILNQIICDYSDKFGVKDEQLSDVNKKIQSKDIRIRNLSEKIAILEGEIDDLKRLQLDSVTYTAENSRKIAKFQKDLAECQRTKGGLEAQLEDEKDDAAACDRSLSRTIAQIKLLREENDRKDAEIMRTIAEKDALETRKNRMIESLKERIAVLTAQDATTASSVNVQNNQSHLQELSDDATDGALDGQGRDYTRQETEEAERSFYRGLNLTILRIVAQQTRTIAERGFGGVIATQTAVSDVLRYVSSTIRETRLGPQTQSQQGFLPILQQNVLVRTLGQAAWHFGGLLEGVGNMQAEIASILQNEIMSLNTHRNQQQAISLMLIYALFWYYTSAIEDEQFIDWPPIGNMIPITPPTPGPNIIITPGPGPNITVTPTPGPTVIIRTPGPGPAIDPNTPLGGQAIVATTVLGAVFQVISFFVRGSAKFEEGMLLQCIEAEMKKNNIDIKRSVR